MSRSDKLQVALFGAGLLLTWAGVQLPSSGFVAFAVAMIGAGVTAGGYQMLVTAGLPAEDPRSDPTRSQMMVTTIRSLLQVGFGLVLILGSMEAAVIGTEGLWQFISSQRSLVYLAVGAVLVATSLEVALGEGQVMRSRWELLASIPLRLASLPMFIIGLGFLGFGVFALLMPEIFNAWIHTTFGPFINTR
ncbi:MAG: hypothetical protein E4H33_02405 [Anaerolineales bacterium]|nr:MAG: hypothetical protein E4H33_02405 [Anaerolineales bacterium]